MKKILILIFTVIFVAVVVIPERTYAATIGQQLPAPESGWQRADDIETFMVYSGVYGRETGQAYNYNGTTTILYLNGDAAKLYFYGTKIRLIGGRHTNRTQNVGVTIDGVYDKSFTQYYTAGLGMTLDYEKTGLPLAWHVVKFTNAEDKQFRIDAIDIDSTGQFGFQNTGGFFDNAPLVKSDNTSTSVLTDKNTNTAASFTSGQYFTGTLPLGKTNTINKYLVKIAGNVNDVKLQFLDSKGLVKSEATGIKADGEYNSLTPVEGVTSVRIMNTGLSALSLQEFNVFGTSVNDVVPPDKVQNVRETARTDTSFSFAWDANLELDLNGYEVYLNGVKMASVSKNQRSYTASNLEPATMYQFIVKAVDTSGNVSDSSDVLSYATPAVDVEPPAVPTGLIGTKITGTAVKVSWNAVPDSDLAGYNLYLDGVKYNSSLLLLTEYNLTDLLAGRSFQIQVTAVDKKGNESDKTAAFSYVTDDLPDTTPPGAPVILSVSAGANWLKLLWKAPDDADLKGYEVYRDGVKVSPALVTQVTYMDINVLAGTTYNYTVKAVDKAGNVSVSSNVYAATPDPNGLPRLQMDYDLKDVADGTSNWFTSYWPILAFIIGLGVSFVVARRVKELF